MSGDHTSSLACLGVVPGTSLYTQKMIRGSIDLIPPIISLHNAYENTLYIFLALSAAHWWSFLRVFYARKSIWWALVCTSGGFDPASFSCFSFLHPFYYPCTTLVLPPSSNSGWLLLYYFPKITKKHQSAESISDVRSNKTDFNQNSALQAACDTSTARVTGCVTSWTIQVRDSSANARVNKAKTSSLVSAHGKCEMIRIIDCNM